MSEATRAEHLQWAKERALMYCERGLLQLALDSLISDRAKSPETYDMDWVKSATLMWLEGELATQEQMREFIEGIK